MAAAADDGQLLKQATGRNTRGLLRVIILVLIAAAAVSSRLFSVIRFESIIHEFDPWFNFRATKYLVQNGFYSFWDWFDDRTWHPLGRVTGGTLYPGLMVTSGVIYHFLRAISLPVDIRNICVLLAPAFSGLTALATYLLTSEMVPSPSAGLLAAAFMGITPGYISRSVAGSYDNEAIAIFLLVFTFYLWIKAVKNGSMFWGAMSALFYGYMVSAWGGYVFITNLLPLHVFVLICMGRYSPRLYVSYTSWYALGTLASMQIPFVGFLPIRSSEHMSALGVFGLLQLVAFVDWVRAQLPGKQFQTLLRALVLGVFVIALSYKVPLTIASVYFVTVTYVNWYNRQHGNKPWRIAKTRPFYAFVIFHNVFLAVYSAITCVAMIRCLKHSFPHYSEPNAVVGTIDALCKIHGPRGLGDAVTYNNTNDVWSSLNSNVLVGPSGLPDQTDVGRIWNEGLAFWGWWFYLSKFYEVLDTAIILAKGKRSTTLQKYHHAGAMLSMWAGMRFMSPPIWMFALVNSGIHAMMYTYYTVSALGYRVPNVVKRTLTTLQITQFLVGSAFAAIHLFVSYTVPVSVAYKVAEKVAPKVVSSSVSSAVASATESVAEALPTATGVAVAFLRKLIYRAAGDEGLAENIPVPGQPIPVRQQQQVIAGEPVPTHNAVHDFFHPHETVEKTFYRTEYQTVPCVDTSGQAFAIYVNLIYLAPLTILFMRFFFKSYLRRSSPNAKKDFKPRTISDAAGDASRSVERELDSLDKSAEDAISSGVNRARDAVRGRKPTNGHIKDERKGSMSPANQKFLENINRRVSQKLQELDEGADATSKKARQIAKELVGKAEAAGEKVEQAYEDNEEDVKEAEKAKENADRNRSPSKLPRKQNKKNGKNGQTDEQVAKPEQEPEPKDLKNTLDKKDGKGLF